MVEFSSTASTSAMTSIGTVDSTQMTRVLRTDSQKTGRLTGSGTAGVRRSASSPMPSHFWNARYTV